MVHKTVTLSSMIPMDNEVNGVVLCQLIRPNIEVDAALKCLILSLLRFTSHVADVAFKSLAEAIIANAESAGWWCKHFIWYS